MCTPYKIEKNISIIIIIIIITLFSFSKPFLYIIILIQIDSKEISIKTNTYLRNIELTNFKKNVILVWVTQSVMKIIYIYSIIHFQLLIIELLPRIVLIKKQKFLVLLCTSNIYCDGRIVSCLENIK